MPDLAAKVRAIGPLLDREAPEGERLSRLAPAAVEALRDTGVLRMHVAAEYGGPACDPLEMIAAAEEAAYWDGAAGWCVMNSATMSSTTAFLAPDAARLVCADPRVSYSGAAYPSGRATPVDRGWRLNGRWGWGSGSDHADWLLGGTMAGDSFQMMYFPAKDAVLHENWDSTGLRGTASGDFSTTDVFVPEGFAYEALKAKPQVDAAIARFPNFTLLASGVAAATLGIARRAVDELVTLATAKRPAYSNRTLAEYPPAQLKVAEAEARVRAARAFLVEAMAEVWGVIARGDRASVDQRARVRLACAHAGSEAAAATGLCHSAAGGSAVWSTSALGRCFRDVNTALAHIQVSDRNLLTFGRLRFGLEADTAML